MNTLNALLVLIIGLIASMYYSTPLTSSSYLVNAQDVTLPPSNEAQPEAKGKGKESDDADCNSESGSASGKGGKKLRRLAKCKSKGGKDGGGKSGSSRRNVVLGATLGTLGAVGVAGGAMYAYRRRRRNQNM